MGAAVLTSCELLGQVNPCSNLLFSIHLLTSYVYFDNRTQKNPDDIVITLALRTPMAKGFKGGFKDTELDYMVYSLLKEVVARSNIDPNKIEDFVLGNVRICHCFPRSSYAWSCRLVPSFMKSEANKFYITRNRQAT